MTIIRQPTVVSGAKRLGDARSAAVQDSGSSPSLAARELDPRVALAQAFAPELAALKAEAHQEGLAAAEAEITSLRHRLESESHQRLTEEEGRRSAQLKEFEASARAALAALQQGVQEQVKALLESIEAEALEVAYLTLTRMLGKELVEKPVLAMLAREAIREHRLNGPITLHLAVADHAKLQAVSLPEGMELMPDATLRHGQCYLQVGRGRIDASLEQQLTRIRDLFLQSLEQSA